MLTRARRVRRNARDTSNDAGITLVELLVVMVLASIVGLMTMVAFNGASKASTATHDRLSGTAATRGALQAWQSLVQVSATAPATNIPAGAVAPATAFCPTTSPGHRFEWIAATDMLFYTNVGNLSTDNSGTCGPPQLVWLAERNGTLLESHYDYAVGTQAWALDTCRTLNLADHASIDEMASPVIFTGYAAGGLSLAGLSASLPGANPFAATTSCATAPAGFAASAVRNLDAAANTLLAQVDAIGIGFTVTDTTGKHTQAFTARAAVYGSSS